MTTTQGSASVYVRGSKLLIGAASVYNAYKASKGVWSGAVIGDWLRFRRLLNIDAPDGEVGQALRSAFLASRINRGRYPGQPLPGEPITTAESDERLARQFGLVNARHLTQGLKSCDAFWVLGVVHLNPLVRGRGAVFWEYPPAWRDQHPEMLIPFQASDGYLGRALRECLSHCA